MKAAYIISEFNPFHKGHEYIINKARKISDADYVICIMSGDFVQRGAPAIIDKYTRTEAALAGGADMVLQLPAAVSLSSADDFALGGINIARSLRLPGFLVFGAECDDMDMLGETARFLTEEPGAFSDHVMNGMEAGYSYPVAVQKAFEFDAPDYLKDILKSPNNLLAVSYLKALKGCKSIEPIAIKRIGAGHNDPSPKANGEFMSSSAIRKLMLSGNYDAPPEPLLTEDDFSQILRYLLAQIAKPHENTDLARRIFNNREKCTSFRGFADTVQNRSVTYAQVCRVLMRMILDIDNEPATKNPENLYARILGVRESAKELINELNKISGIPIIVNLSKDTEKLNSVQKKLLDTDLGCENIYRGVSSTKSGREIPTAFERRLITF